MKYLSKEKLKKIKTAWEEKKYQMKFTVPTKTMSMNSRMIPQKKGWNSKSIRTASVFLTRRTLELFCPLDLIPCLKGNHCSFTVCFPFCMAWVSFKTITVHLITLSINVRCLLPPLFPLPICHYLPCPEYFISILLLVQLPHHMPCYPLPYSYFSTSSSTCRQGHSGPSKQRSPIFYGVNSRLFSIVFPVPSFQIASLILSCFLCSCVSWSWSTSYFLDRKVSFLPLPTVHIIPFERTPSLSTFSC